MCELFDKIADLHLYLRDHGNLQNTGSIKDYSIFSKNGVTIITIIENSVDGEETYVSKKIPEIVTPRYVLGALCAWMGVTAEGRNKQDVTGRLYRASFIKDFNKEVLKELKDDIKYGLKILLELKEYPLTPMFETFMNPDNWEVVCQIYIDTVISELEEYIKEAE